MGALGAILGAHLVIDELEGQWLRVRALGPFTADHQLAVSLRLTQLISGRASHLWVDGAGVTQMDHTGAGEFERAARVLRERGGELQCSGLPAGEEPVRAEWRRLADLMASFARVGPTRKSTLR